MLSVRNFFVIAVFLLVVAIASFLGFKLYVDHQVKAQVDELIKGLWSYAKVEYADLHVGLDGRVVLEKVSIHPFEVQDVATIAKIEVAIPDLEFLLDAPNSLAKGRIPEQVHFKLTDLRLAAAGPLLSELRRQWVEAYGAASLCMDDEAQYLLFGELGINELHASGELGAVYDKASSTLKLTVKGEHRGASKYDLNATFRLPTSAEVAAKHFTDFRVVNANMNYSDEGYNQKYVRYCAAKLGLSAAQFVERKAQQTGVLGVPGLVLGAGLREGYRSFMQPGGTYNIAIRPLTPVNPLNLLFLDAQDVVKTLNLAVTVNGGAIPDLRMQMHDGAPVAADGEKSVFGQLPSLKSLARQAAGDAGAGKEANAEAKQRIIRYDPLSVDELASKQGAWVRLVTMTDLVRVGRIDGVANGEVIISWPVGRGEMAANVPLHRIKSVELMIAE